MTPYMIPLGEGNPRWSSDDSATVDLLVCFPHLGGEVVPYTAARGGEGINGEIFARAEAGEFGPIADYAPPPAPVPASITDRQFFHALAKLELVSAAEALAAVKTGDLPSAFEAAISALPADKQFDARMLFEGSTTFHRDHAVTNSIAAALGWSAEQVNDLFRLAATL